MAESFRDNDIGDMSLSLSEDRYRNEPLRVGGVGSSRRQAAASPTPQPRVDDLDAALPRPMASKLQEIDKLADDTVSQQCTGDERSTIAACNKAASTS